MGVGVCDICGPPRSVMRVIRVCEGHFLVLSSSRSRSAASLIITSAGSTAPFSRPSLDGGMKNRFHQPVCGILLLLGRGRLTAERWRDVSLSCRERWCCCCC
ncbi:unnamed protein product [Ectocarpus sp. 12 AP-2014]